MSERLPEHDHELLADDVLERGVERLVQVDTRTARRTSAAARSASRSWSACWTPSVSRVERLEEQLKESEAAVGRARAGSSTSASGPWMSARSSSRRRRSCGWRSWSAPRAFVAELQQQLEARETRVAAQVTQMQAGLRRHDVASLTRVVNDRV